MQPDLIAGRYRVQRIIGRGGMGAVWLCRDEVLGRDVAVKQVGRLPGESLTDTARALREARSSAALNHRNVVSVFDVVEADNENWLVMEYVPSRTLAQIIREDGPMPPLRAARIGAQVADGLAAAHARGTIHRDVKPGNILIGEDDQAKISDFGIARPAGDSQLTQTGLLTGTPAYFSPELARGGEPGPASDVWALGAALYAAVEDEPAYPEQRNALAMLTMIAERPPRPMTQSGPLADAVRRMMDRDPSSRWAMADAAHALCRLADRKEPRFQEDATAAFFAPVSGVKKEPVPTPPARTSPAARAAEPRPAAASPRERRRRARLLPWVVAVVALLAVATAGYALLGLDDGGTPAAGPRDPVSSGPEENPSPSASPSPSTDGKEPRPSRRSQAQPTSDAAKERFIEGYFDTVPDDTDTGWTLLAPRMQAEVGREDYNAFWGSVDSVDAANTRSGGARKVYVTLTYSYKNGKVVTDEQLITLARSGDGYLIADDTVLSSRTESG